MPLGIAFVTVECFRAWLCYQMAECRRRCCRFVAARNCCCYLQPQLSCKLQQCEWGWCQKGWRGGGRRLRHIREANCTCELQWLLHFLIPADERQLQVAIFGCWCSNSSSSRDSCSNCSCPQRSKAMSSVSSLGCILSAVLIKNLCSLWHPFALFPPSRVSICFCCICCRWWCGKRAMKQLFRAEHKAVKRISISFRVKLQKEASWLLREHWFIERRSLRIERKLNLMVTVCELSFFFCRIFD